MKLSVCASFLLGLSMLAPATLADTEFFNTPAPGSVYRPGSRIVFSLDKVSDDSDKVTYAKLYRHEEIASKRPTIKKPAPKKDDNNDNDNDNNNNDNDDDDDDDEDDDDDDEDDDDDDEDDDDDNDDDNDNDNDNDNDDNDNDNDNDNDDDDDNEDGDTSNLTYIKTLKTIYGANLGDDNSDFMFDWIVEGISPGTYHVQMEEYRIDEDTSGSDGDSGDQDDLNRSRNFLIVTDSIPNGNPPAPQNTPAAAPVPAREPAVASPPAAENTPATYRYDPPTSQQYVPPVSGVVSAPVGSAPQQRESHTSVYNTETVESSSAVANKGLRRRQEKKNMIRAAKQ
ncbi:hypothetical protein BJV82DRAFT_718675 [Fennellomyces sp. T-0311]|nr:hypothetical protein BJV82DRAFT_718675 [Fennellomyces sp. T-0311]